MLPFLKSAAYRNVPDELLACARPVKMAPETVASVTAFVNVGVPFQPAMVPPKVAKMKAAGAPSTLKPPVFATIPVGLPPGMLTTRERGVPGGVEYSVDTPVP